MKNTGTVNLPRNGIYPQQSSVFWEGVPRQAAPLIAGCVILTVLCVTSFSALVFYHREYINNIHMRSGQKFTVAAMTSDAGVSSLPVDTIFLILHTCISTLHTSLITLNILKLPKKSIQLAI